MLVAVDTSVWKEKLQFQKRMIEFNHINDVAWRCLSQVIGYIFTGIVLSLAEYYLSATVRFWYMYSMASGGTTGGVSEANSFQDEW